MPSNIDHLAFSPLDNFFSAADEVELSPLVKIVRIDRLKDSRVQDLLGPALVDAVASVAENPSQETVMLPVERSMTSAIPPRVVGGSRFTLQWHYTGTVAVPFNENYDRKAPMNQFAHALCSLRLLKDGYVGRLPTRHWIKGDPAGFDGRIQFGPEYLDSDFNVINHGDIYLLESSKAEELRRIFSKVSSIKATSLHVSVTRFGRLYAREDPVDELLDLIVALESLYLPATSGELAFRLASRAAVHLGGKDGRKKYEVFQLIKELYDLRSKVVHGSIAGIHSTSLKGVEGLTVMQALEIGRDFLRRGLNGVLLEVGEDRHKEWAHHLDALMVKGEPFFWPP